MNFNSGARLVLVGPVDGEVNASWDWNDPDCVTGNCPLVDGEDYDNYLTLFSSNPPDPLECVAGGKAYIAEVPEFDVAKQRLGSYGTRYIGGTVNGHLVHTPVISPAIFGSLSLAK